MAVLHELYTNILTAKRVPYGRAHTVQTLADFLHTRLAATGAPILDVAANLYRAGRDALARGVALGLLSPYGLGDWRPVLPFSEAPAADSDLETSELAQALFRKLIARHPGKMKAFLLRLVQSEDACRRRFVAETLRPVQENRRFYTHPEYPHSLHWRT